MILLDTNVVSELMRKSPDPAVEAWVRGHPVEDLFFSAVGEAELRYGAAVLPAVSETENKREDADRDESGRVHCEVAGVGVAGSLRGTGTFPCTLILPPCRPSGGGSAGPALEHDAGDDQRQSRHGAGVDGLPYEQPDHP